MSSVRYQPSATWAKFLASKVLDCDISLEGNLILRDIAKNPNNIYCRANQEWQ